MTVQKKIDYNWLIGTALTVLCLVASSFLVFGQDKQKLNDTMVRLDTVKIDLEKQVDEIKCDAEKQRVEQSAINKEIVSTLTEVRIAIEVISEKLESMKGQK